MFQECYEGIFSIFNWRPIEVNHTNIYNTPEEEGIILLVHDLCLAYKTLEKSSS